MGISPQGAIPIPLELFGGEDTEVSPIDLPEGLSPGCNDVAYLPGSAFSRPGASRLLPASVANAPMNLLASFTNETGTPINVYLTGDGNLWYENAVTGIGTLTGFGTVQPGSIAITDNGDGETFLAFSDGKIGVDIPRVYDGVNYWRLSQGGPGAPPSIADFIQTEAIASISPVVLATISGIVQTGSIAYVTTVASHGLTVGQTVIVANSGESGFDGPQTVQTVPSATTFTYTPATTGIGNASTGTVDDVIAIAQLAAPPPIIIGDSIVINGSISAGLTYPFDNNVGGNPATWIVTATSSLLSTVTFSLAGLGAGVELVGTTGGTATLGGQITSGTHQFVVIFETKSGYLTKPSPIGSWLSQGNLQAVMTGIPTGGVYAITGSTASDWVAKRIIAFTASGGAGASNFYYIPPQPPNSTTLSTVIPDNTTTTLQIDFSDAALLASVPIGVQGNNLFNLDTVAPCLGLKQYSNRLFVIGERNHITNMLNMGFDGGVNAGPSFIPLGWLGAGGSTHGRGVSIASPSAWQVGWQITGTGSDNNLRGILSQPADQDEFGVPIFEPLTAYSVYFWAEASQAGMTGQIIMELVSDQFGAGTVYCSGSIDASAIPVGGGWVTINMGTPATVPAGTRFLLCGTNLTNGQTVTLDELWPYPTLQPVSFAQGSVSYLDDPESFDLVTGIMQTEVDDQAWLALSDTLRDQLYIHQANQSEGSIHVTYDSGTGEPSSWEVNQVSNAVRILSPRGVAKGEDCEYIVARSGLYIFNGGTPLKISQEEQAIWETINWAAQQTIWVTNDPVERRVYVGLPIGEATSPSLVLVMDYRELKTESDIGYADPEHISYAGRILSTDLSRKWTKWFLPMNCGEILPRAGNVATMCFGGGLGTGLTSGGFYNAYSLNSALIVDDDYGNIDWNYITYFFLPPGIQQQLQLAGMNLYEFMMLFVSGNGSLQLTFLGNALSNAWPLPPAIPLSSNPLANFNVGVNVVTERMAIQFQPGSQPSSFNLNKLIVFVKQALVPVGNPI